MTKKCISGRLTQTLSGMNFTAGIIWLSMHGKLQDYTGQRQEKGMIAFFRDLLIMRKS
jgi:hypothetical protein